MTYEVRTTAVFDDWLARIRDKRAVQAIARSLVKLQGGLFGNSKDIGGGLHEMKVDVGGGYRIYFLNNGREIIVILLGGDKSSQSRDIKAARKMKNEL